jgi:predicted metal-dependent hydrolase
MLHNGINTFNGINVCVVRKSIRRINLRVGREGDVSLSLPNRGVLLSEAENFLAANWDWVLKQREKIFAKKAVQAKPNTTELIRLRSSLSGLCAKWAAALNEKGVTWAIREMKSQWGSCHWIKRHIVFSSLLAGKAQDIIEYVVVHEFTHFAVHDHGLEFKRLMTERLPNWKDLRKKLNEGAGKLIQGEFFNDD